MLSADDRRIPSSSAAAAAPRLMLRREVSRSTILDGAWWPRSHDPVVEVSNLVAELEARRIPVAKIMLNPSGWDSHPRRIGVDGRTVRLGWFTTLDAELLIATTHGDRRVDLLVVSPDTSTASADTAMTMASSGPDALTAAAVWAATSAQTPPPACKSSAEADWESEGGRVNGHRTGSPFSSSS
jgi:hypothetical protein